MLYLTPLGTSSAVPTRERHLSAFALQREGEVFLFDCGEGTQFRLLHAGVRPSKIACVLVSHFHGDHFFGLMGLLSTLTMLGRKDPLHIAGPKGIAQAVTFIADVAEMHFRFEVRFVELDEARGRQMVRDENGYWIEARPLDHRIPVFGFRLEEEDRPGRVDAEKARRLGVVENHQFADLRQGRTIHTDGGSVSPPDVIGPPRPGASFAYCPDTRPCENGRLLGRDASLLFHEATFAEDLRDRAADTGHSTAAEAASVAAEAGAARLMIGHFSARYKTADGLVQEARRIFPETIAAEELKRYEIRPPKVRSPRPTT